MTKDIEKMREKKRKDKIIGDWRAVCVGCGGRFGGVRRKEDVTTHTTHHIKLRESYSR